jgi:fructose-bisphosphate aldolase class 1
MMGMGARFAKWRAVIHIADGLRSRACVSADAHALARYAALCQEASLVPIVEPEVLMEGVSADTPMKRRRARQVRRNAMRCTTTDTHDPPGPSPGDRRT